MRLAYAYHVLDFKEPAGTSRGTLTMKPTFYLKVYDENNPDHFGLGEAAVFPGLSPEAGPQFGAKLLELLANMALGQPTDLTGFSSIQFGLEQALLDYASGCRRIYYPSEFTSRQTTITINGLIWMGDYDTMLRRVEDKLRQGFKCLKLKIGAIGTENEMELIESIRRTYPADRLEIRVDANCAFTPEQARHVMHRLAALGIHSIEQPISTRRWEDMAALCAEHILPIALDEELIGIDDTAERKRMLDTIKPDYIILKPALCGGFSGATEWIGLAAERSIGWWVTSALESNIGLNALAQWVGYLQPDMPQGLGTGALYKNNAPASLALNGELLSYDPASKEDMDTFINSLDWRE